MLISAKSVTAILTFAKLTAAPVPPHPPTFSTVSIGYVVGLTVVLMVAVVGIAILLRKYLRDGSHAQRGEWSNPAPDSANASAFMAASMQGVIEKLRAQEKELARLHVIAQERAQESERLTEEVTRNMPTGLLLVNATGAISSTNPAAEEALGIRPLRYRSYKEILGADSDLTRMLTATLAEGKTIQRGEVEHMTPQGEPRHLGVTISPIFRPMRNFGRVSADQLAQGAAHPPEMQVSGALCLMSDLTE